MLQFDDGLMKMLKQCENDAEYFENIKNYILSANL